MMTSLIAQLCFTPRPKENMDLNKKGIPESRARACQNNWALGQLEEGEAAAGLQVSGQNNGGACAAPGHLS